MGKGHPGRVAVITGGASGIGQACARRLAEDGVDIAVADVADTGATVRLVQEAGRRILAVRCDITDPGQVSEFAEVVEREFGRCDILFNNAGKYSMLPFEEITFDVWRSYMALNLDAMFLMAKAFLPGMKRRGWGRIVNMASNSYSLVVPGLIHYIASKGGVIGFTRALATECGPYGVTVNAIAPGPTRTGKIASTFYEQHGSRDEAALDAFLMGIAQGQAIKRTETPHDIVGLVSFLTSDDSAFMTGQTLVIDGGFART
jgi:NAD(P)-dependent dehydrogenase (short-subunit alcohol dehydrogenase family)